MPTAPRQVAPRLEAVLAAEMATKSAAREAEARDLERRAQDMRAAAKAQEKVEKTRGKALLKQVQQAEQAAASQAEQAGGQPITLPEPYAPGQIQQNLQQAMGTVPVADIAGREAPVTDTTISALQNALRGIPEEQMGRTETDTTVPVRTGKGIAMVPMRTTRRTTTPTGLTQAQALRGAIEMATEQRLNAEAARNNQKFAMEQLGLLIGSDVPLEEIKKIPPGQIGNFYAWPEPTQQKVIARQKKILEDAETERLQKLETARLAAKASGDNAETSRIEKEIALIKSQNIDKELAAQQNITDVQMLQVLSKIVPKAKAGLYTNAGEVPLTDLMPTGMPTITTNSQALQVMGQIKSQANELAKTDIYKAEPSQIYSLQSYASAMNMIVTKGTKGGTNFLGVPTDDGVPAFALTPWRDVVDALMMAERSSLLGLSNEDAEHAGRAAEDRLKEWGIIARVDETRGHELIPANTGNMKDVSNWVLQAYSNLKTMSRETNVPLRRGGVLERPVTAEDAKAHELMSGIMDRWISQFESR